MQLPVQANLWLPAYVRDALARRHAQPAKRLWVALTDHYEPFGGGAPLERARARVAAWCERWPAIAHSAPLDDAGNPPCFTFFYPQDEYHPEIVASLAGLSRTGITDVEVHIHHTDKTHDTFREKILDFCHTLERDHGLLHRHNGRLVFGFIHGNWALDNSLPNGLWCGLTGELQLLNELGCYADFTMPSAPSPTQSRIINRIYWTHGDPTRPRGFDVGTEAAPGGGRRGDLLMIEGPLGLRWRERRIETGELAHYDPPTPYRVSRWLDLAPRLGEDQFLKLFGHSAREDNAAALIGTATQPDTLGPMFQWLLDAAHQRGMEVRWVSAYNMWRAVDSIVTGSPAAEPAHTHPAQEQLR